MSTADVLVVEDDPAILRFVRMALARRPLRLSEATTLAEARRLLAAGAFDIVVTDLMLSDGNGLELLRELRAAATAGGRVPVPVVMSAGLQDGGDGLSQYSDLVLRKPFGMRELRDTLERAVQRAAVAPPDTFRPRAVEAGVVEAAVVEGADAAAQASADPSADLPETMQPTPGRDAIIADNFAGNARLFESFRASVLQQLPADIDLGDRLCDDPDAQALRRHAHNLKTVMGLLGHHTAQHCARRLERLAAQPEGSAGRGELRQAWQALRQALRSLLRTG